jgi:SAM-dependent methyltransferase
MSAQAGTDGEGPDSGRAALARGSAHTAHAHAAEEHRRASAEFWEEAASGWVRRQRAIREFGAPISHWMVQAINPQPGQRVLELAAGLGETGLLAAELVAPTGGVILSDQAEGMLEGARARAAELALTNVEFQVWNAEWIDLPVASVDAALCRWGYMLMADPLAALLETRRVLRPGGRVALAVWDALAVNPWARELQLELIERGLVPAPSSGSGSGSGPGPGPGQREQAGEPAAPMDGAVRDAHPGETAAAEGGAEHRPGPFSLGDSARLRELLEQAGFTELYLDVIDVNQSHPNLEAFWETMLDLSRDLHDVVLARPAQEIEQIRASLAVRLASYTAADGTLEIPGRSLVATASA